jgi:signal peptidase I
MAMPKKLWFIGNLPVVKQFVVNPYRIPSSSMEPTLHCARPESGCEARFSDRVLANRLIYHFRDPRRGEIIVFNTPSAAVQACGAGGTFVKRLIGLPGDRIQMKDGLLHINEVPVKRERLSDFIGEDPCGSDATARVKRWKETLPNGVTYESLDCVDNGFYDNTNVYTVPAGHFFMMGDNRDNSTDSRVLSAVGYVPFENIVGRAQMIFFSIAEGEHAWMFWRWPTAVRWNRLFKIVR